MRAERKSRRAPGSKRRRVSWGGLTRSEIASRLGVTRARVGQIETRALEKLRRAFGTAEPWRYPAFRAVIEAWLDGTLTSDENPG